MTPGLELARGMVAWASLDPARGREQSGHRPVLIIASNEYSAAITTLTIALPITTVDRGWPNHIPLQGPTGLDAPSWAMTEQPRTLTRARITGVAGTVDRPTMAQVEVYLRDFLGL